MKINQGYIAITTALILSLLIVAVAISLGSSNYFLRFSYLDLNSKQTSFLAARSCLNYGRLKLAESLNYGGNETLAISSYQCSLQAVETSGSNKILKARSQVRGATTNLKLIVKSSDLSTVSIEELKSF